MLTQQLSPGSARRVTNSARPHRPAPGGQRWQSLGSLEIERHLAFRDYLRERPDIARAYDQERPAAKAFILTIRPAAVIARKRE